MVKDQLFKWLFIPLTGLVFPFVAGLVSFDTPLLLLLLTLLFFIAVIFLLWQAVVRFTLFFRSLKQLRKAYFLKLMAITMPVALFTAFAGYLSAAGWMQFVLAQPPGNSAWTASLMGGLGGLLLALMYEVVFLSVEKELDSRVLQQVDRERMEAELSVLKSELDPHFFFNCMNTLSYLVKEDADKAWQFVHKLSNVYQYFLRNKEKKYVSLHEELAFLSNYHFLLRIRFDDNIRIEHSIDTSQNGILILPCTLQVLVENAIKHNFFSEKEPLVISIVLNGQFISVSNLLRPKLHAAESTHIGLQNLKARYRIITNQNILIQKTAAKFLVRLPIVKTNQHDKGSDH